MVQGSGFMVHGSGFRVHGSGFMVQGSGFRVQGSGPVRELSGLDFVAIYRHALPMARAS